jgi:hypothetical protein
MALRRDNGYVVFVDPGADKPILEASTLQCVHCYAHWWPSPGSGIERGFCFNCNGPICGRDCAKCVPREIYLENLEKGRPEDFRPIVAPAFTAESDSPLAAAPSFWTPGG